MSIFGAMQSGISGLAAQSSAMGAISDNISNVNTVGYKNTNVAFQTLVTKQTSSNSYSPGGVQPVTKQGVNVQGLLSATSSSTAVAISGDGYFVVNQAANPGEGDLWAYTRAGDFDVDENGYLKNTGGFFAQGWSLLPWDGNVNASVVNINGINYMKAYYDAQGNTVYINDNIIDNKNLHPINLANIGGTATATQQLSFGANLPSSDPIFNAANAAAGGRHSVSALIYDSLGNASNISMTFTKESSNSWGLSTSMPAGAASITLTGTHEKTDGGASDVYYASGQLEFTTVPANGSTISITDESTGKVYTFEFITNGGTPQGTNIAVDSSTGITSVSDFVNRFVSVLKENMPGANRFSAGTNSVQIVQSVAGSALTIDASKTLACVQAAVNPNQDTGIPTGIFKISELDDAIRNCGRFDFSSDTLANYLGKTITIDGQDYTFVNTPDKPGDYEINLHSTITDNTPGAEKVDIDDVVNMTVSTIKKYVTEPDRFIASGTSMEILPTGTGGDIVINMNGLGGITGKVRDEGKNWITNNVNNQELTITNRFNVNVNDIETGAIVPAVRFNADGTPKYFFADSMEIEWANGAENMNNAYKQGTAISLNMGNVETNDGLTNLSGSFTTDYIKQDGAKFGSYSGVNINENGVVTALFDNGETRPIAILPLATFANANGMEALTGNAWIETDSSGQPLLKQAGTNGAGEITSNSLELSTVDLATEFSNMIVTQRAYSAATKIITTADEMLDELTRMT